MKLLAENSASLQRCIDPSYQPDATVVCRYRNAVQFTEQAGPDRALKQHLLDNSISEGARIVGLMTYKGVAIDILDETTRMTTGSLKSIDGCLTTSFCCLEKARRISFESGGNTGSALTRYGRRAGLETFFFCPADNVDLLDSSLFDEPNAHLIGVANRGRVKELTALFGRTAGIRHVPDKSWRNAAAMFRGLFILEQLLSGRQYDWLSQTVSAGFGPIGMYNVLQTFRAELRVLPAFLGIQQEANCPMYAAWKPEAVRSTRNEAQADKLLTRVMYDATPQTYKTSQQLHQLLQATRGDLLTVNAEEFSAALLPAAPFGPILNLLRAQDIPISLRSGDILEKTGLIALVGTLKAIDAGTIHPDSRVLCCLTSGVSAADGLARPEITVRDARDVVRYAATIAARG